LEYAIGQRNAVILFPKKDWVKS